MEQIPGPCAQTQKFILLLPLRFWAVYAQSKWPTFWLGPTPKWWCTHIPFVFCSTPSPAMATSAGLVIDEIDRRLARCRTVIGWRRRRRRWLVAGVVDNLRKQILSATSHLRYCLFCRPVISSSTRWRRMR